MPSIRIPLQNGDEAAARARLKAEIEGVALPRVSNVCRVAELGANAWDVYGAPDRVLHDPSSVMSDADKNLRLATELAAMGEWTIARIRAIVRVEGTPGRFELYLRP